MGRFGDSVGTIKIWLSDQSSFGNESLLFLTNGVKELLHGSIVQFGRGVIMTQVPTPAKLLSEGNHGCMDSTVLGGVR